MQSQPKDVRTVVRKGISLEEIVVLQEILIASVDVASRETAYPNDQSEWTQARPLYGHCGSIAYVVQTVLGGDIMSGRDENDVRQIWNRLPCGHEVALASNDPFFVVWNGKKMARRNPNKRFVLFLERVEKEMNKN